VTKTMAALVLSMIPLGLQAQEAQNWRVQCFSEDRAAPLACIASQTLLDSETQAPVLRATVTVSSVIEGDGNAMLNIEVPPGIHIPTGLRLEDLALDLVKCDGNGCAAQASFAGPLADRFMQGGTATVRFRSAGDRDVALSLMLDGFAESYARIALDQ